MELGCFLAGALVSSQGHMVTEEMMAYIEPIRDFLAIIFFASIGTPHSAVISREARKIVCFVCIEICFPRV